MDGRGMDLYALAGVKKIDLLGKSESTDDVEPEQSSQSIRVGIVAASDNKECTRVLHMRAYAHDFTRSCLPQPRAPCSQVRLEMTVLDHGSSQ